MEKTINAKQFRAAFPKIVRSVQRGQRFIVLYRSRPAFRVVPVEDVEMGEAAPLEEDPLYRAEAMGSSTDGLTSEDHDSILYGDAAR